MPELPALPLGAPELRERISGRRGARPTLRGPGAEKQAERLGAAIGRITDAFEAGRVTASDEPAAAPEQVLVLEVAGELTDFVKAIERVPGLEFLVEAAQERVESGAEFAAVDREGRAHRYDRLLYLVFSDHAAWQELLGLWQRFQQGERMPYGKAPFAHMFSRLETLRPWDDSDRLERTGALRAWALELAQLPDEPVQLEIELWLRAEKARQERAIKELAEDLKRHGGQVLSECVRPEISYHGVLAEVPARLIAETIERHDVRWVRTNSIRFFHAVGQLAVTSEEGESEDAIDIVAQRPLPATSEPRLAILDGVPLAGHTLLAGRITVDDPDGWEGLVEAGRRNHGTAMASLVVHGDLNANSSSQPSQVYVRPILWDQTPSWVHGEGREELPRDRLAVDVIHSAIARLYEGEDPAAPSVRVVVLALGDSVCQFDRFISPLARLLDWLQSRHEILILVSAGNHTHDLTLPGDLDGSDPQELQHEMLCAIARSAGMRRLLSPAESINALTIGAAHADSAPYRDDDGRIEPIITPDLPNVCSALGGGVRRSVKPDLLLPGGRQLLMPEPRIAGASQAFSVSASRRPPGLRAAAPGRQAGILDATSYSTGTSAATALAGHHAGHVLTLLEELRARYEAAMPGPEFDAVLVKAALVHSAVWGSARRFIEQANDGLDAGRSRELATRMVGYGRAEPAGMLVCDEHRASALAASRLTDGHAHAYRFPLPAALAAVTDRRRLTLTMAWLTPINPEHRLYRRAAVEVEPGGLPSRFVERTDVEAYAARRGTVQHEVRTGRRAVPYAPGADIELVVSCRADAGSLAGSVPYAIIVTLEAPENLSLPIYQQVRQGLRVPVAVRPAP
jgi:hypothetical protein